VFAGALRSKEHVAANGTLQGTTAEPDSGMALHGAPDTVSPSLAQLGVPAGGGRQPPAAAQDSAAAAVVAGQVAQAITAAGAIPAAVTPQQSLDHVAAGAAAAGGLTVPAAAAVAAMPTPNALHYGVCAVSWCYLLGIRLSLLKPPFEEHASLSCQARPAGTRLGPSIDVQVHHCVGHFCRVLDVVCILLNGTTVSKVPKEVDCALSPAKDLSCPDHGWDAMHDMNMPDKQDASKASVHSRDMD
jgi:hypothetical protein